MIKCTITLLIIGLAFSVCTAQFPTMITSGQREYVAFHSLDTVAFAPVLQETFSEGPNWSSINRTASCGLSDWWGFVYRSIDSINPYTRYNVFVNSDTVLIARTIDSSSINFATPKIGVNSCGAFWCAVWQDPLLDIQQLLQQYPRTTIYYDYFYYAFDSVHQEYVWRISFIQTNRQTPTFDLYLNEYVGTNRADEWIGRTLPHGSFNGMVSTLPEPEFQTDKRALCVLVPEFGIPRITANNRLQKYFDDKLFDTNDKSVWNRTEIAGKFYLHDGNELMKVQVLR